MPLLLLPFSFFVFWNIINLKRTQVNLCFFALFLLLFRVFSSLSIAFFLKVDRTKNREVFSRVITAWKLCPQDIKGGSKKFTFYEKFRQIVQSVRSAWTGRKIKRGIFVKPNTMKKLIVFVKHYEKINSVCKHYEKINSVWQTL